MKYERFNLSECRSEYGDECESLKDFLGNTNVEIMQIAVTSQDHVYVFYEPQYEKSRRNKGAVVIMELKEMVAEVDNSNMETEAKAELIEILKLIDRGI